MVYAAADLIPADCKFSLTGVSIADITVILAVHFALLLTGLTAFEIMTAGQDSGNRKHSMNDTFALAAEQVLDQHEATFHCCLF